MRAVVVGTGRMGSEMARLLTATGHTVVAHIARPTPSFWEAVEADAVIDFSHASQVAAIVRGVLPKGLLLLTGTTGWQSEEESLQAWAKTLPHARWTWSSNFSRGILLLKKVLLALQANPKLLEGWESALMEIHHQRKKDKPSGTAHALAQILPPSQGITSVRVGEVVGEHSLWLSAAGEELVLTHRAHSREVFARGALWALEALAAQPAPFVGPWEALLR